MASLRGAVLRVITRNNPRYVAAFHSSVRMFASPDKVTHTGQVWAPDDYRMARFTDRQKEINENFAIDLVAEEPPIKVHARYVWCDGVLGGGALGHPKVFINLDQEGPQTCAYCGLRYVRASDHD
ncbi:PREDICTED: NADH dehydrogenase [ubiquinone] iron-sulfur protein 6, mitochondrial-like isoform X1 [Acropora digitifera]|uniref:NADH dehydrogenase [ubiquinone] iron-sulfur protein 6, mitochondrial-like isoform X1 n=1 Tax=Acropora digitifera TaxID=70779 RepID=UPI00077A59BB|nr:PREDICTED: NADH dehydrogenase [ubiquinone] iron-sulfur protein 6, mitochondrial-like isoform X1 [Acropora digitifera]